MEALNLYELSFEKTIDPYKKFDLAIKLKKLSEAYLLAQQLKNQEKWKVVADLANELGEFEMAEKSMINAKDYNGLLFYYTW